MRQEPGAAGAADAIESLLAKTGRASGHPARTGRVAATSA
jgi:hypothetical protein